MPVTVTYALTTATITAAGATLQITTTAEGVWSVSHMGRHLTAASVPDLQAKVARLERNAHADNDPAHRPPPMTVPATLRLGRDARITFEDVTVLGYATEGRLEVIRANGRRDAVPEDRVWYPLDAATQGELLRLVAEHITACAALDNAKKGATMADVEGSITVTYDHAGHYWSATAVHDGTEYGPFEERHAADAAYLARSGLFTAQFPWTVEPAGTGANPCLVVVPTERISSADSYRTREEADRHVAAHRAYRKARHALMDIHATHRFQPAAYFSLPPGKLPDAEGWPL